MTDCAADLERIFRDESARALATLIRLLGDFDVAEEALQDAFAVASDQWPRSGTPANPRAWLVSVGRNRAIDRMRRDVRFAEKIPMLMGDAPVASLPDEIDDEDAVGDDRLRLIFTCCHPALAPEVQVALTLRTVCGLTTDEIARSHLVPTATMAQRLVRATAKIRDAKIPYRVPPAGELPGRIESVCAVVYLVFTEGYAATRGDALVRRDLCGEAIRLGRLLVELMPDVPELRGLLALMLLHDARRDARTSPDGELILLDEQDRSRWDRAQIDEGLSLVESALRSTRVGPYAIQAAIAALHARAATPGETDWRQIASLYALLVERHPSPVVELNHAVAVAMTDGPEQGLLLVDALAARGELRGYHLMHAARADLLRRLGREGEAVVAYEKALELATAEPERRFLRRQISGLRLRDSVPASAGQ
ncbi:MAG TPA: RNA polymerase sigma factor [Gemmatimonadaceae bacterium]|nr:RNA polymerase sigma factor [Gemmatimonadaceae bacterium]